MDVNHELAELMRRREGVFRPARCMRHIVAGAVKRGEIERVRRGIYVAAGTIDFQALIWTVVLADPDAIFIGATAAYILNGGKPPARVTAVSQRIRWDTPHHRIFRRQIDPDLVYDVGLLRVTSPALTALNLVAERGGNAIDDALRNRILLSELWTAYRRASHRPGNMRIRSLLCDSRDEPWSEAERVAHRALREARITGWRANHPVRLGWTAAYLDIALVQARLGFEIDGYAYHSDRESFSWDRRRDRALSLAGWRIHRFSAAFVLEHPEEFVEEVRALMRASGVESRGRRSSRRTRPTSGLP